MHFSGWLPTTNTIATFKSTQKPLPSCQRMAILIVCFYFDHTLLTPPYCTYPYPDIHVNNVVTIMKRKLILLLKPALIAQCFKLFFGTVLSFHVQQQFVHSGSPHNVCIRLVTILCASFVYYMCLFVYSCNMYTCLMYKYNVHTYNIILIHTCSCIVYTFFAILFAPIACKLNVKLVQYHVNLYTVNIFM